MPLPGKDDRPFVGRKDELEAFDKVLRDPAGQAVLVVGQAGMGKTMLVNRMARCAQDHPDLTCGAVRYEVTPTDDVAGTMALMMDHAFEAAQVGKKFLSGTSEQWRALLNVVKVGDLVMSLKRDPAKDTRTQFLDRLRLISAKMPPDTRAIFIIDPEKYMPAGSANAWRLVVRDLPDKVKFLFAQRPEDVLISSHDFLDEEAVEDLLNLHAPDLQAPIAQVRDALGRYHGHPYAVPAALNLIADGLPLADLPPTRRRSESLRPSGIRCATSIKRKPSSFSGRWQSWRCPSPMILCNTLAAYHRRRATRCSRMRTWPGSSVRSRKGAGFTMPCSPITSAGSFPPRKARRITSGPSRSIAAG